MALRRIGTTLASLAAALTVGTALSLAPAAAQTTELKLAHFLPTANGMHKDFLEPWSRDRGNCTGGNV